MENTTPVKLTGLVPMLESWDMQGTIDFYTLTLGFEVDGKGEEKGKIYWLMLHRNNVWIMFRAPNQQMGYTKSELSGQLYLYANNVDVIWENVQNRATIVYPIESFDFGMREFALRDNNGYILTFGKPIDTV